MFFCFFFLTWAFLETGSHSNIFALTFINHLIVTRCHTWSRKLGRELEKANGSALIGPVSVGVATCVVMKTRYPVRRGASFWYQISKPLCWLLCGSVMVAAWCLCVCGFGIPALLLLLLKFGSVLLWCCTSGPPLWLIASCASSDDSLRFLQWPGD